MTRKDFDLIARVINGAKCDCNVQTSEYDRGARTQRFVIASYFAAELSSINDRFNRQLFMRACGVDEMTGLPAL